MKELQDDPKPKNGLVSITIIDRNNNYYALDAPTNMDLNVMEVAKSCDVDIQGTCGGLGLCASCHSYVVSEHNLPGVNEVEEDMLYQVFHVEENSRLACQLKVKEEIDGLVLRLAPN